MKNYLLKKSLLCIALIYATLASYSQMKMMPTIQGLIPNNTITHKAKKAGGNWANKATWENGEVPGLGAIVLIPKGTIVTYNVDDIDPSHIFAIRNEGIMKFRAPGERQTKLLVDTYLCGMNSELDIKANKPNDGTIEILFKAFDIKRKKNGTIGGAEWNAAAINHYSDGNRVNDHFGEKFPNDKAGVLGRYNWDPNQVTLGLMTMGKVRIIGKEKTTFLRTTKETLKNKNMVTLESIPENWKVNDQVVLSGTQGIFSVTDANPTRSQDEKFFIQAINGKQITFDNNTQFKHSGIEGRGLYAHLSNLSRNITFKSIDFDKVTQRAHTMFMETTNVKILNTLFKDLGRTNKHDILDDFKFDVRKTVQDGKLKKDEDGKQFVEIINLEEVKARKQDIQNQRGRYALHFHRMKEPQNRLAVIQGCVVWGSPGWGMVHHDSKASFKNNVVYFVDGCGIVAESGSETGIWENNLVTTARPDRRKYAFADMDRDAPQALNAIVSDILDDDFRIGEAYGLQGRAVRMINNVAASSREAYAYDGGGNIASLRDEVSVSEYDEDDRGKMFPLNDFVHRAAAPLLEFRDNEAYGCSSAFRSKDRVQQAFHHVLSIVENHTAWNTNRAMYITTNFGYMFKNANYYNGNAAGLVGGNMDNLCIVNTKYNNWSGDGYSIGNINRVGENAQLNFTKVTAPGFDNLFTALDSDGVTTKRSGNIPTPIDIEFNPNSSMVTKINLTSGNFEVVVSGSITDRLGTYKFGHSFINRFTSITGRIYDFEDNAKLCNYLNEYPATRIGKKWYTTITEYISDRTTGETSAIEFKIELIGYKRNFCDDLVARLDNINKSNYEASITVSPNPVSSGIISINQKGNQQLGIYNILGKKVKQLNTTENQFNVNVSALPSGMYILTSGTASTKFVIK